MKQCWAVESQKRQELGFATAFGLKAHFQIRLTLPCPSPSISDTQMPAPPPPPAECLVWLKSPS